MPPIHTIVCTINEPKYTLLKAKVKKAFLIQRIKLITIASKKDKTSRLGVQGPEGNCIEAIHTMLTTTT